MANRKKAEFLPTKTKNINASVENIVGGLEAPNYLITVDGRMIELETVKRGKTARVFFVGYTPTVAQDATFFANFRSAEQVTLDEAIEEVETEQAPEEFANPDDEAAE